MSLSPPEALLPTPLHGGVRYSEPFPKFQARPKLLFSPPFLGKEGSG